MADSVAARETSVTWRNLRGSQQNCIKIRMQLLRQNQESLRCLKQYRPYCFIGLTNKPSLNRKHQRLARHSQSAGAVHACAALAVLGWMLHPDTAAAQATLGDAQCRVTVYRGPNNTPDTANVGDLSDPNNLTGEYQKMVDKKSGYTVWVKKADFDAKSAEPGCAASGPAVARTPNPPALSDLSPEMQATIRNIEAASQRNDYAEVLRLAEPAAEQGNHFAQYDLGTLYTLGLGVPVDYDRAVYWMRKSADQGNRSAEWAMGVAYARGKGVPRNLVEAAAWFRKSAEHGFAVGQMTLGEFYQEGAGVPKDYQQAMFWARKAADQGDAEAQAVVGGMYWKGEGVPKDFDEAVKWIRKSAEQGYAEAEVVMGDAYAKGLGVPQDDDEALRWWRKAAGQGNADAKAHLAQYQQQDHTQAAQAEGAIINLHCVSDNGPLFVKIDEAKRSVDLRNDDYVDGRVYYGTGKDSVAIYGDYIAFTHRDVAGNTWGEGKIDKRTLVMNWMFTYQCELLSDKRQIP